MALLRALVIDPKVTAQTGWQKIVLVGEVGRSTRMAGYSFDLAGEFKPVSPDLKSMLLLRELHKSMKVTNANGREWLACVLRIGRNGEVGVDFEYNDPSRWAVTPDNLHSRIQEFAAMAV